MIDEPIYKSPPTFRRYEDYHDAEQYTKGWNDAMHFIFDSDEKVSKKQKGRKNETGAKRLLYLEERYIHHSDI